MSASFLVSFDSPDVTAEFAEEAKIPFDLLFDMNGEVTQRFTYEDKERKAPVPSMFITDRFGELRFQKIVGEACDLPDSRELQSWLALIESECPECSHL